MISIQEKRISIQDLAITEANQRNDIPFEPKRDLGPKQWSAMRIEVQNILNPLHGTISHFQATFLASVAILNPNIVKPFITDEVWKRMKKQLPKENGPFPTDYARSMKIVAHERTNEKFLFSPKQSEDIKGYVRALAPLPTQLSVIADFHILGDEYKTLSRPISDPLWNHMKDFAERFIRSGELGNNYEQIGVFSDMKIMDPERFRSDFPEHGELINLFWDQAKNGLAKSIKEKKFSFVNQAANMAIISAHKVNLTDKGLELVFPENETDKFIIQSQMPERRRF